jgi:hypothetical protein
MMHYFKARTQLNGYITQCIAWHLKEWLKTIGWTVERSGTGTAGTTGVGDLITSFFTTTPGGINCSGAWYILRDPNGLRSIMVQTGTGAQIRIWVSFRDGFPSGGHTATTPARQSPVTDEVQLIGASGGYLAFPVSTAAPGVFELAASDTVDGETFVLFASLWNSVVSTPNLFGFGCDAVTAYETGDDNSVWYDESPTGSYSMLAAYAKFHGTTTEDSTFGTTVDGYNFGNSGGFYLTPYQAHPNLLTGLAMLFPVIWGGAASTNTAPKMKGVSKYIRQNPFGSRQGNDAFYRVNNERAYRSHGPVLIPTDPTNAPTHHRVT